MIQDSSGSPTRTKGPSHKQHVRIWYEFYKLALNDPRLADQVERSRGYYEPWGAVTGLPFDKWWPSHSHLFEDLQVREIQRVTPNDAVMYLAVPLGLGAKRAINQINELFTAKQKLISAKLGGQPGKSTKVGAARFCLTKGSELRGRPMDTVLRFYRDVFLPLGRPKIGEAFARKVSEHFQTSRTKLSVHFLPKVDSDNPSLPNQLRQLRSYVERAEELMLAAAKGDFPGRTKAGSRKGKPKLAHPSRLK